MSLQTASDLAFRIMTSRWATPDDRDGADQVRHLPGSLGGALLEGLLLVTLTCAESRDHTPGSEEIEERDLAKRRGWVVRRPLGVGLDDAISKMYTSKRRVGTMCWGRKELSESEPDL